MKNLVVLGSTGSIGTQTLDIAQRLPGRFQIVGLSANNNTGLLASQANSFGVSRVSIGKPEQAAELQANISGHLWNNEAFVGVEGLCRLATLPEADLVVLAVAGACGIAPAIAALAAGKDVALACKEVLVAAGEIIMETARATGAKILPIDSEHSAIFQCLQGAPENSIETILLTASGGPFRTTPKEDFARITPERALKHPTWNMGGLVTINSATLMNKGLEIIEARWLFDVPAERVEVVVHPQSIVHSMVRFRDGSTLAQLGLPDMRLPIQYALVYPDRPDTALPRMELSAYASLTFEAPDEEKFSALRIARRALAMGGVAPAVMNAANEAAVALFLERRIPFTEITRLIERAMDAHSARPATLENVIEADAWGRRFASEFVA